MFTPGSSSLSVQAFHSSSRHLTAGEELERGQPPDEGGLQLHAGKGGGCHEVICILHHKELQDRTLGH
ncbi:hypothetical protein FQA47_022092 [Oryzias melastigma]|uniref:Uncharacterized protein n=1 Tax=Oryzias melastigma TaxID=30732 RepID=A0A834C0X7_ORYME|nr:hypothetical protein FQA47_022092 [Oryzias melastigma]